MMAKRDCTNAVVLLILAHKMLSDPWQVELFGLESEQQQIPNANAIYENQL